MNQRERGSAETGTLRNPKELMRFELDSIGPPVQFLGDRELKLENPVYGQRGEPVNVF